MFSIQKIKYVEVEILDVAASVTKNSEKGLLSNYDSLSGSLRILTDCKNSSLYANLSFYNITSIKVALLATEEELFFTRSKEDQKKAEGTIEKLLIQLKREDKVTASGFVVQDKYIDIPQKYLAKYLEKPSIPRAFGSLQGSRNTALGSIPPNKEIAIAGAFNKTPTTTTTSRIGAVNRAKSVTFIKRRSNLPTGIALATMRFNARKIAEGAFEAKLPKVDVNPEEIKLIDKEKKFTAEEIKECMSSMNNFNHPM